ncbi:hypothetical protein [Streptomyces atratus]|uniref:hypothetical protein n=1 Tax=Streptomyces atratus TaxID=1893 RepID=UPI0033E00182
MTADRTYGVKLADPETLPEIRNVVEHDAPQPTAHRRPLPTTDTLVPTGQGPVRGGSRDDGSLRFLGIPYAQP